MCLTVYNDLAVRLASFEISRNCVRESWYLFVLSVTGGSSGLASEGSSAYKAVGRALKECSTMRSFTLGSHSFSNGEILDAAAERLGQISLRCTVKLMVPGPSVPKPIGGAPN